VYAGSYFVLITCRNSQETIQKSLTSIKEQAVNPEYVIVINDGSTDNTNNILDDMQKDWPTLYVITNPDLGYDISRVVRNWNDAIKLTKNKALRKTDYHMIATDDTVYPRDYAQKIISYMDSNPLVAVASGNYANYKAVAPHGAGRFVRNSNFEKSIWHGYYPEQMGYESAILYEASRSGYSYAVIEDARFKHTRTLGQGYNFYEFGAGMRTLGYHPLSVLVRFLRCFMMGEATGRIGAIYMLYYYLTFTPKDDGYNRMFDQSLRNYVRATQSIKFHRFRRAVSKSKILSPYPKDLTKNVGSVESR
jgi:glycosyltransferase involved in cell wall biosynthesis